MITNASDIDLTQTKGSLPNVESALFDWFQNITAILITKTEDDYRVVETETEVSFIGVRQPMKPQELFFKPEGQRAWKWETIHAQPSLILSIDDIIEFNDVRYRVMSKENFSEYGFVKYDIVEDFEAE